MEMETPMTMIDYKNGGRAGLPPAQRAASAKQVALITKLAAEKDLTNIGAVYGGLAVGVPVGLLITSAQASGLIDALFACPKLPVMNEDGAAVSEGYFFVEGLIYQVVKAKSHGGLYAKVFTESGYEFARGAMRLMANAQRLTLEQAAEAGVRTGRCVVCAKLLTVPASVEAGIGPVCARKFGA